MLRTVTTQPFDPEEFARESAVPIETVKAMGNYFDPSKAHLFTAEAARKAFARNFRGRLRDLTFDDGELFELMHTLIDRDPEVLEGQPYFVGSQLPVLTVLKALDAGTSLERLVESHPFLTDEHVKAARFYARVEAQASRRSA